MTLTSLNIRLRARSALILAAAVVVNYPIIFGVAAFIHTSEGVSVSTADNICLGWTGLLLAITLSEVFELWSDRHMRNIAQHMFFSRKAVRQVLFVPYVTYLVIASPIALYRRIKRV